MQVLIEIGERNKEKIREYCEEIVKRGVFDIKNGKAVLSFDGNGVLMEIRSDKVDWRRKKVVNRH